MSECAVCGTGENLHEHHIDGNESNNDPENRVTLCSKHHRRVHGDSSLDRLKDDMVLELKEKLPEQSTTHVECEYCGYDWDTKSVREKATCPSCQRKTEVDSNE